MRQDFVFEFVYGLSYVLIKDLCQRLTLDYEEAFSLITPLPASFLQIWSGQRSHRAYLPGCPLYYRGNLPASKFSTFENIQVPGVSLDVSGTLSIKLDLLIRVNRGRFSWAERFSVMP